MVWLIVGIVVCALALAFWAMLEALFRFSVVRRSPRAQARRKPKPPQPGSVWALYGEEIARSEKWLVDQPCERVSIQSDDGLTLRARFLDAGTDKSVLLMHGYRSRATRDFSCIAPFFLEMGYNLLLPDQRAHGESEGTYICFGAKERYDCLRWAEYLDRRVGGDIFLDGISMGAATVLMAADLPLPESVRGIIADCGFTSPAAIMEKVLTRDLHLPRQPFSRLVGAMIHRRAGFDMNGISTLDTLRRARRPVLFVHGTADAFVPCDMTREAYAACASEKRLVLVEGAPHGGSYLVDRQRCRRELIDFLEKHGRI